MKSSNKNYNRRAGTPSLIVGLSLAVIAAAVALIVSSQTNRTQEQEPAAQTESQVSSASSSAASEAESNSSSETSEKKTAERSGLEIRYIDVGQGSSTLVMLPGGENLLIDAGSADSADKLVSYLQDEGIEKIDYLVATNADPNDIGGMPSVIESFEIGRVYTPDISDIIDIYETDEVYINAYESFTNALSEKKLTSLKGSGGTHIYFSLSLTIDIISPNSDDYSELNNYSAAVLIKYGQQKFIFMSDAETYSEQEIIDKEYEISADVIMVGNHGNASSSAKSFIEAVSPKYAVISCGKDNSEGYPHSEVLKTLEENEVKVFRTDQNGTITLKSDGMNELRLITEKTKSKNTESSAVESGEESYEASDTASNAASSAESSQASEEEELTSEPASAEAAESEISQEISEE